MTCGCGFIPVMSGRLLDCALRLCQPRKEAVSCNLPVTDFTVPNLALPHCSLRTGMTASAITSGAGLLCRGGHQPRPVLRRSLESGAIPRASARLRALPGQPVQGTGATALPAVQRLHFNRPCETWRRSCLRGRKSRCRSPVRLAAQCTKQGRGTLSRAGRQGVVGCETQDICTLICGIKVASDRRCKHAWQELDRLLSSGHWHHVLYVGDGRGDFCPVCCQFYRLLPR